MKLSGCRVLITGAAGGLGTALAEAFAPFGPRLCLTDLAGPGLDALPGRFPGSVVLPLDVTSAASVEACRVRLEREWGGLDLLVNNAGLVFGGPFETVGLERHAKTVAVNLVGPMTVTHTLWPLLTASDDFKVVFVASASGYLPVPHMASYAASKWALRGLALSLDEEFRLRGLGKRRVLTVNPSYIGTGLFAGAAPPFLTPLLEARYVARALVAAVKRDRRVLDLPWSVGLMKLVARVLPDAWFRAFLRVTGVSTSMTKWTGRASPRGSSKS